MGAASRLSVAGELSKAIDRDFGSFDALKKAWTAAALGIQGSGWAWLGRDGASGKLAVVTTANQDPLLSHTPILGIDMWCVHLAADCGSARLDT